MTVLSVSGLIDSDWLVERIYFVISVLRVLRLCCRVWRGGRCSLLGGIRWQKPFLASNIIISGQDEWNTVIKYSSYHPISDRRVGVAISASLLPPAVNTGTHFAMTLFNIIVDLDNIYKTVAFKDKHSLQLFHWMVDERSVSSVWQVSS